MRQPQLLGLIISASFMLDQLTKYLAGKYIDPAGSIILLPVLQLVNIRNKGAAFGMGGAMGNGFFIALALIAIGFVGYMLVKRMEDPIGLSLILSGAAGNLTDRIVYGSVRDFIDAHIGSHHWPAFNVADSALTVGVGIILLRTLLAKKHLTVK